MGNYFLDRQYNPWWGHFNNRAPKGVPREGRQALQLTLRSYGFLPFF